MLDPLATRDSRMRHASNRRLSLRLFFPRSVKFGATHSCANGAFPVAPSTLCQRQAMPSISSYSTCPAFHLSGKGLPSASAGSRRARRWHCRIPWVAPSTDNRFEAHTRRPGKPAVRASACAPLLAYAGTSGLRSSPLWSQRLDSAPQCVRHRVRLDLCHAELHARPVPLTRDKIISRPESRQRLFRDKF